MNGPMRIIYLIAILGFWLAALATRMSEGFVSQFIESYASLLILIGLVVCVLWALHAMRSPGRDLSREHEALKKKKQREERSSAPDETKLPVEAKIDLP